MHTNMNRRRFSAALFSAGVAGAALAPIGTAFGQQPPGPVEGKDFTRVDTPQPPGVPAGKIEVLEFFSYACPHCSAFEPAIEDWEKKLPADVVLRRVPVAFLMNADNFMHTYYALETTGTVQAVQMKIFNAIHVERQRLDTPENIAAFVGKNGGDATKFLAAFKSFSVATSVTRAKKMMADYKVDSVPTLIVQGRWMTSPSVAGSQERALAVTEQLVQRARSGKG
jgi:thiol:disulfide interchange protein DsbA